MKNLKKDDRYPTNWSEIAEEQKRLANWTCQRCGLDGCPAWYAQLVGYSLSQQKRLELSVHHCDYNPANNAPENLKVLCSGCHLFYHQRGQGNLLAGQLFIPQVIP
ncbi:MAG: HNH endonuclease [Microcystaceae cyanobacterium]